jgi:Anion-transporting ATPase
VYETVHTTITAIVSVHTSAVHSHAHLPADTHTCASIHCVDCRSTQNTHNKFQSLNKLSCKRAHTQVLKLVRGENKEGIKFDRIVIDTAPTGHTLRMLSYPEFLDEFFEKIIKIRGRFVPGIQPIFHRFSMNCTIVTAAP